MCGSMLVAVVFAAYRQLGLDGALSLSVFAPMLGAVIAVSMDDLGGMVPKRGSAAGVLRKSKADKERDMRSWFQGHTVYDIGLLLARSPKDGKVPERADDERLADVLAKRGILDLTQYAWFALGKKLLNPVLGLTSHTEWTCPACNSAHGSRIGCSNSCKSPVDPMQLRSNNFYVRDGGTLVTISKTCEGSYVQAQGLGKLIKSAIAAAGPTDKGVQDACQG